MAELDYDYIVVGAGISGSCAAYQLAKRGVSVLLLEKVLVFVNSKCLTPYIISFHCRIPVVVLMGRAGSFGGLTQTQYFRGLWMKHTKNGMRSKDFRTLN